MAVDRLIYILFHTDTAYVELMLSLCYLGWAFYLLTNNPKLVQASNYAAINDLAPPIVVGSIFLLMSITKLVGVLGSIEWLRAVNAAVGTLIWTFISVSYGLSSSPPTGQIVYIMFALTCTLIVIRQARLHRDGLRERKHL